MGTRRLHGPYEHNYVHILMIAFIKFIKFLTRLVPVLVNAIIAIGAAHPSD